MNLFTDSSKWLVTLKQKSILCYDVFFILCYIFYIYGFSSHLLVRLVEVYSKVEGVIPSPTWTWVKVTYIDWNVQLGWTGCLFIHHTNYLVLKSNLKVESKWNDNLHDSPNANCMCWSCNRMARVVVCGLGNVHSRPDRRGDLEISEKNCTKRKKDHWYLRDEEVRPRPKSGAASNHSAFVCPM